MKSSEKHFKTVDLSLKKFFILNKGGATCANTFYSFAALS